MANEQYPRMQPVDVYGQMRRARPFDFAPDGDAENPMMPKPTGAGPFSGPPIPAPAVSMNSFATPRPNPYAAPPQGMGIIAPERGGQSTDYLTSLGEQTRSAASRIPWLGNFVPDPLRKPYVPQPLPIPGLIVDPMAQPPESSPFGWSDAGQLAGPRTTPYAQPLPIGPSADVPNFPPDLGARYHADYVQSPQERLQQQQLEGQQAAASRAQEEYDRKSQPGGEYDEEAFLAGQEFDRTPAGQRIAADRALIERNRRGMLSGANHYGTLPSGPLGGQAVAPVGRAAWLDNMQTQAPGDFRRVSAGFQPGSGIDAAHPWQPNIGMPASVKPQSPPWLAQQAPTAAAEKTAWLNAPENQPGGKSKAELAKKYGMGSGTTIKPSIPAGYVETRALRNQAPDFAQKRGAYALDQQQQQRDRSLYSNARAMGMAPWQLAQGNLGQTVLENQRFNQTAPEGQRRDVAPWQVAASMGPQAAMMTPEVMQLQREQALLNAVGTASVAASRSGAPFDPNALIRSLQDIVPGGRKPPPVAPAQPGGRPTRDSMRTYVSPDLHQAYDNAFSDAVKTGNTDVLKRILLSSGAAPKDVEEFISIITRGGTHAERKERIETQQAEGSKARSDPDLIGPGSM